MSGNSNNAQIILLVFSTSNTKYY